MDNWTTLKKKIYFEDGSLRDIFVLTSDNEDWGKWVDMVNKKYRVEFYDGETDQTTNKIDFKIVEECWKSENRAWVRANVKLGTISIQCLFLNDPEIEFDIDPREFKSIDDHNSFIEYLKDISITLDKDVLVTDENTKESKLMMVKKSEVILNCA